MVGIHGDSTTRHWGWWLRANGHVLEDRDGRAWRSVREAFWQGRLGFPSTRRSQDQEELLLRVLETVDRPWGSAGESRHDLFGGDKLFWGFYLSWLSSVGLTEAGPGVDPYSAPLSDEGQTVLLMLRATREPSFDAVPFSRVVEAVAAADHSSADAAREAALHLFEREVVGLPYRFARERIGLSQVVTLSADGVGGRMPIARVVWSQAFGDQKARDDFFGWLAERVDRWPDWGDLALQRGGPALTAHFLNLMTLR